MAPCAKVQFVNREEPYLFRESLVRSRVSRLPLVWSLLGHVFLLALLAQLGSISWFDTGSLDLARAHVEFIRLRAPDRVYYTPDASRTDATSPARAPETGRRPNAEARLSAAGRNEPGPTTGL